jgi:hypothetical protein
MSEESLIQADGDSALQLQTILDKLKQSVNSYRESLGDGSHSDRSIQTTRFARWVLQRGMKAHADLSFFRNHLSKYSEESPGHYVSICQVRFGELILYAHSTVQN